MVFRAAIEPVVTSRNFGSVVLVRDMANRTLHNYTQKKTFPLCARPTDIHTMLLLLSFVSCLPFFLPLPNCDFFPLQSQKISPNQFADLFIENLALFFGVDSLTHTRTYAVATHRRKKCTPRKRHDPDQNSSYKGSQMISHARNQIVAGRLHFARRVNPLFCAALETDCKKWRRHGGG